MRSEKRLILLVSISAVLFLVQGVLKPALELQGELINDNRSKWTALKKGEILLTEGEITSAHLEEARAILRDTEELFKNRGHYDRLAMQKSIEEILKAADLSVKRFTWEPTRQRAGKISVERASINVQGSINDLAIATKFLMQQDAILLVGGMNLRFDKRQEIVTGKGFLGKIEVDIPLIESI